MAGSVLVSRDQTNDSDWRYKITVSWVGDSADGSVPNKSLGTVNGYVSVLTTNPGTPAPTDNYDITLLDSNGVDIAGGALADRDTAVSEAVLPVLSNTRVPRLVIDELTFTLSGNSAAGAQGTLVIYVQE